MSIMQLPMLPSYYVADGTSQHLHLREAAETAKQVTLNNQYQAKNPGGSNWTKHPPRQIGRMAKRSDRLESSRLPTLFEEIQSGPLLVCDSDTLEEAVKALDGIRKDIVDLKHLADELRSAIIRFLARHVFPGSVYLMPHSGGLDSRIVSSALCTLVEPSKVHLVCHQPEVDHFLRIMKTSSPVPNSNLIGIRNGRTDYFAESANFEAVGRLSSEAKRFLPHRYLLDIHVAEQIPSLIHKPIIVEDLFSDEILRYRKYNAKGIREFVLSYLFEYNLQWNSCVRLLPFVSFDVLRTLARIDLKRLPIYQKQIKTRLKHLMLEGMNPSLSKYGNPGKGISFKNPFNRISDSTRSNMRQAMRRSWYVKRSKPRKVSLPRYFKWDHPAFREYTKAAICEHLIQKGCTVQ
jgi:hypothetical protein